jgi:hypothetical protein
MGRAGNCHGKISAYQLCRVLVRLEYRRAYHLFTFWGEKGQSLAKDGYN